MKVAMSSLKKTNKSRKWFIFVGIAALFLVPFILKFTSSTPKVEVNVQQVKSQQIKASILASGNLVYQDQAQLSPEVIGKVKSVLVKEGQHVDAGQVVLLIDDQTYRADLAQQQAIVRQQKIDIEHQQLNLVNQGRQYQRKVEMHNNKMISDAALDDARFAYESAKIDLRKSQESLQQVQAQLSQSNERLAKTTIRSPIAGTVIAIDIKVGETAVAGQIGIAGASLMTIANTASLMAEVNVDEADIGRMQVGQEVQIHTAAYPDTALIGQVKTIPLSPKKELTAQSGASLARNYSLKVSLANPNNLTLHPGMTCRAEIYTATSGNTLAVPLQAVQSNNDGQNEAPKSSDKANTKNNKAAPENFVFVVENGKSQKRKVSLGISDDTNQEILQGLKQGDQVVIGPYKTLRHLTADQALKVTVENDANQKSEPPKSPQPASNNASH